MKRSLVALWAALGLLMLLVVGCAKDSGSDPQDEIAPANVTNEQSAKLELAKGDEFVKNDEITIADQDMQLMDYGTFGKVDANITPLRWGRFVTSVVVVAQDTVFQGDSISVVHVHKDITGVLKIKARNEAGDTVEIDKPFTDQSDRNIVFKRIDRNPKRFWLNWIPVATSLVAGGSTNDLIAITEIQMVSKNDSVTITDPLAYYLRYKWVRWYNRGNKTVPEFFGGDPVTVRATLVSSAADTDIVALRFGFNFLQRKRVHMTLVSQTLLPNGNYERVFETQWFAHFHPGFFHVAVDALTKATLYDDTAPYSVSWWGIPYRLY
jgi:hypothetical protein